MKQTICSVGDSILLEQFPESYDTTEIEQIINKADVKLFNLENVISDKPIYASAYCGGVWLLAKENTLDDVLRFGFNGCSFANNHTMDYSYDGLFETLSAVNKRNIPICGAGKDLQEASDYVVVESEHGKTAVISLCATFNDAARAGNPSENILGRPGLNPLRFSTIYQITSEHMKALKEMAEGTHIDGRRNRSRLGGYTPNVPEGCFGFGEYVFCENETDGKTSRVNAVDMERTENTIKKALEECQHVVVNIHSHEIKHDTDDEPDDFLIEFCHKCIDAGASAVFGTGTHQLKAVELYKNKPIFYSLGNFIFQSDMVFCLPDDFRERYHMPYGLTPKEQVELRCARGNGGLHADVNNFRSIMPFLTYEDGKLTKVILYLLRLDMHTGLPALATQEEAQIIYDYLVERNKQFGTKMQLKNTIIEVELNHD